MECCNTQPYGCQRGIDIVGSQHLTELLVLVIYLASTRIGHTTFFLMSAASFSLQAAPIRTAAPTKKSRRLRPPPPLPPSPEAPPGAPCSSSCSSCPAWPLAWCCTSGPPPGSGSPAPSPTPPAPSCRAYPSTAGQARPGFRPCAL